MHSLQGLCPSMLLWVHSYVDQDNVLIEDNTSCIGCRRCSALCPTGAITIRSNEEVFKKNESWSTAHIRNLYAQADTGGILLAAWAIRPNIPFIDHMLLDASQVTNPSIDPLREPMELRTYLGKKPHSIEVVQDKKTGKPTLKTKLSPQLKLEYPFIFSAMSYGALNLNAHRAMLPPPRNWGPSITPAKAVCTRTCTSMARMSSSRLLPGVSVSASNT